uniref:Protein phosphatase 1, regulatory (inhibitor) subunit 14Aa n=1 Tax=Takifugu rubripes TaxID=31033 RepID=A0A674P7X3_TAKRU
MSNRVIGRSFDCPRSKEAAKRLSRTYLDFSPDHGCQIPKRHARVTVKYNRKELQKRLDLEKWIDEGLDQLYSGQEADMPEEVNIDDLIDLPNDEERVRKLRVKPPPPPPSSSSSTSSASI